MVGIVLRSVSQLPNLQQWHFITKTILCPNEEKNSHLSYCNINYNVLTITENLTIF